MSSPFQSIIDYLDTKEFNHNPFPEENRITLVMSGKHANYRFVVRITNDGEFLQFNSYYPFFVRDEKLRVSSAELITRANYSMPLGKLEMDMKDGEVHFHLTHLIDPLGLSTEVIERLFMTSFFTIDRYFPAFMQHIHAGYTPEDAVYHAELDYHAESVVEEPKKPKKKADSKANPGAGSKDHSNAPRKKPKVPPSSRNADAEIPVAPSEGSDDETPVSRRDQEPGQKSGGERNQGQGQGELPL